MKQHIAIFASGTGSNAKKIIEYFWDNSNIKVSLVVCNKPGAGVLALAEAAGVETLLLRRQAFYETEALVDELQARHISLIVLAGFLWLVPGYLVQAFEGRILNIHPALLPNYGGKGMYGMNVHRAVKAAAERESGITIHLVDQAYDEGRILFQQSCPIEALDRPEDIARKVLQLEHEHFAPVVENYLKQLKS